MKTIMAHEIENAIINSNEYQICYDLVGGEDGRYGISCCCRENGTTCSDYQNDGLFAAETTARKVFRLLVDNVVFPVHIPDVLLDLQAADGAAMASA